MDRIADFEIVRELGRGGMGTVFEAIEHPLGRRVALKLLHPEWAVKHEAAARFIDEARKVAKLSHPAITKIYRFGQVGNTYYLALEYIDGSPLDSILSEEQLSVDRVIEILLQIASALGYAHQAGIVHRDIKPGNILCRRDGGVVLGDFGIAKDLDPGIQGLTGTGVIIGTPAYMSPEQIQSKPISPASDIYSLGILAFEMITGRVPFTADTAVSLLLKHINENPPSINDLNSETPPAIVELIEKMLEKNPLDRPRTGIEVAQLLSNIQKNISTSKKTSDSEHQDAKKSSLVELELTVACFVLVGFNKDTCERLLPARVAFLLESWYRLARQAVSQNGGIIDRYVGDRITCLFGFPQRYPDHVERALGAAKSLHKSLEAFNHIHDLDLNMRVGIACGTAMAGKIVGDLSPTSVQGALLGDMIALSRSKVAAGPVRLNRAAYRRLGFSANVERFEDPRLGEAWSESFEDDNITL